MKKYIFPFLIILVGVACTSESQKEDKYKILLDANNNAVLKTYDTLATLDYLSASSDEGMPNVQFFCGFDYPAFTHNINGDTVILSNGSIQIQLITIPFDSVRFVNSYKKNNLKDYDSPFFGNLPADLDYPAFMPKTEIGEIEFMINSNKVEIPKQHYKHLYDVNSCFVENATTKCGLNAYMADNGKVLLTVPCGQGAASYISIFVFDENGKFEQRIEEGVI